MGNKISFKDTYNKPNDLKWVVTIIIWTFIISIFISYTSSGLLPKLDMFMAFVLLLALIFLGVIFDIVGIAVATATDVPFHSMAAKNVKGAAQAIALVKKSEKVASFCNDVVGDIVGVISGTTAAVIVARIAESNVQTTIYSLLITAAVAALTVGGKAFGKGFAMRRANAVVYRVAVLIYYKDKLFKRKRKTK